jgi:hypothetical protein
VKAEQSKPASDAIADLVSQLDAGIELSDTRGASAMGHTRVSGSVPNVRRQVINDPATTDHLRRFPWNWTHIDELVNKKAKTLTLPTELKLESKLVAGVDVDGDTEVLSMVETQVLDALEGASPDATVNGDDVLATLRPLEQYNMDPMAHQQHFIR